MSVTDGSGRRVPDGGLARWLASVAPASARGEIAVALVSDARSRALNRRYRRRDRPTDVLAFPARGEREPRTARVDASTVSASPKAAAGGLGDLVIATGLARRQARERGHQYRTELRVLALHGLLHLLGYDHHEPAAAARMRRAEARLRRRGGLHAGLIERTGRR
ncbi:MAG TPA: rRNA maturation RNase YbeY [Vicinamibacterales bacterium]|nr:rRNA maturation RNase YbeY [Vicinamibacterales bacterium]